MTDTVELESKEEYEKDPNSRLHAEGYEKVHNSRLKSLDAPLFCDAIIMIMNIDCNTEQISFNGTPSQFVDSKALTFIGSSLRSSIDSVLQSDKPDLNEQVTHLLPLCKHLAIESHIALTSRMESSLPFEMSEFHDSIWSSTNLSLLCSESSVDRVFGFIVVTAKLEWVISCLVDRRLQLKDNLQSDKVRCILGNDMVLVLQCLLGCVKGFNLKNLTWHGFISPSNIPQELCSLLFCSVLTISSRLSNNVFKARTSAFIPEIPNLSVIPGIPFSTCESILENSALIHPNQKKLWLIFLQNSKGSPPCGDTPMLVSINVVLLQHCLRRLWVVASDSDVTRCSAQNTKFYITLDEIFSPVIPSDVARPGASYYSSMYSKNQSDVSENVLIPILGSGTFYALLDLFVHGEGLRLRDKLSHCECDTVNLTVARHLFHLTFSILARFCDKAVQKPCNDLACYYDSYHHRFHPFSMMLEIIKNIETTAEKLTGFIQEVVNFGIEEKKVGFVEKLHEVINSLQKVSVSQPQVPLFIGLAKAKYFSLLLEILKKINTFSSELAIVAATKFELFKDRKLRSRQRQNFSTLIGALPYFTKYLALTRTYMYSSTKHVENLVNFEFEENKEFVKHLKASLKCFENLVAIVSLSKWVEIGCFLVNHLENWNDFNIKDV